MTLPFSAAAFFANFAAYHEAAWPALILAYLLGGAAIYYALHPGRGVDVVIGGSLALLWLWTGIVYHGIYFAEINPAAIVFAIAFVLQGGLFAYEGLWRKRLTFSGHDDPALYIGLVLIAYAMLIYPALGWLAGHGFPAGPSFGITPCPLTIFTFGLLLMADRPLPRLVLPIPLLWAVIGGSAAFLLGVWPDGMLPVAAVVTLVTLWREKRRA